jgi:hypothetical protein
LRTIVVWSLATYSLIRPAADRTGVHLVARVAHGPGGHHGEHAARRIVQERRVGRLEGDLDGELVEHPRAGVAGQGRERAAGLELGVDDAVGAAEEEAPGTVVIGLDQEPPTLEVLDLASGVSR